MTRNAAGNAPSCFTIDKEKIVSSVSSLTTSKSACQMIPTSSGSAWNPWGGPILVGSVTSGWGSGCGDISTSDESVDRHVPRGKETIRPADIVAIEVINRLCAPCTEFALAEHWYASMGLEDLLGVPDSAVTKDRSTSVGSLDLCAVRASSGFRGGN